MSYYSDPLVTLLHGDCIEVMAELEAALRGLVEPSR